MALEIKSTPVLTGKDAERFIREAEENEKNPQKTKLPAIDSPAALPDGRYFCGGKP